MIYKLGVENKVGDEKISILYPGQSQKNRDTGLGTIGRIDQANIPPGVTIKMHPHINDDILSYFRTGKVLHTDSGGITAEISRNKLMLMKSGKVFFHEEKILERLEGLQIFIRPKNKDDEPLIMFHDLTVTDSYNEWRLIASPIDETKLRFSSETWIYDMHLTNADKFRLPSLPKEGLTALLYVFQGDIIINNTMYLSKGESAIAREENLEFTTNTKAELVLFYTNENAECYTDGMFSGNQYG